MATAERAALEQRILKLRKAGASYRAIGKEVGLNPGRVYKLVAPLLQPVAPGNGNVMTVRERAFLAAKAAGASNLDASKAAAKKVGAKVKQRGLLDWAARVLEKDSVKSEFLEMLDRKGLSDEKLVDTHLEQLQATRSIVVDKAIEEVPDNMARVKALELGYHIRGRLNQAETPSSLHLHLSASVPTFQPSRADSDAKIIDLPSSDQE